MQLDDSDHQLLKREIRDKTLSSYFWAGTAAVTTIASVALATAMGFGVIGAAGAAIGTFESVTGLIITTLGGIGAAVQSYSYDREVDAMHERLENELAKGAELNHKDLGVAIHSLSKEIHQMQEHAPARADGKSWQQYVDQRQLQQSVDLGA